MKQKSRAKKWTKFFLRWTIAVVGIGYVVWKTPLYDRVTVLDSTLHPVKLTLIEEPPPGFTQVKAIDPATHQVKVIDAGELVSPPDQKSVAVKTPEGMQKRPLLALRLSGDLKHARELLIENPDGTAHWIKPAQTKNYKLSVPHPLVDRGLIPMVRGANPIYIWLAIGIFPITFIITSLRWNELLKIVGINMGASKAFVINMVGAFYNTFMPGSTGGDVLKAWYAAKLAPDKRTRAVISVIVDRVVGLIALIILGGSMSGYLAWTAHQAPAAQANELVAQKCLQVAVGAALIILLTIIGLTVFYIPSLRRLSGLEFLLCRLPMQAQVGKAIDALELYRQHPWKILWMLIATFPVHITVIVSVMLAGIALELPLKGWYYWVVVPVVVLAGSIPISPQGAGVMEFFAILLTRPQGATVSQAFALTMSIRLVQIIWNLSGGIFVIRGGYHAPTEREQETLVDETPPDEPPPDSARVVTSP
jgi:uncharacterized membrane protein YbhN (UPF0104 family)